MLGLGLLAIALEAVRRRPVVPGEGTKTSPVTHRFGRGAANAALTVGIVLLWALWVVHAMASFWLVLVVITLPLAMGMTRRAIENLLRPPGSPQLAEGAPSVSAVCIGRGIRAALIIGAVAVLAWGWGIDLAQFHGEETWVGRLADGALCVVVIAVAAMMALAALGVQIGPLIAGAGGRRRRSGLRRADLCSRRHRGHVLSNG